MSHAGNQRVTRLVSAGVPITDAFQAVVEEIIDNGPTDFDTLSKRVQAAMFLKEKRILSAGWRTWDDFTRDILDQISGADDEAVPTLASVQGKWSAIEFTRGVTYTAIPKAGITYTVWDETTRLRHDLEARMLMDIRRQKGDARSFLDRYPDAGDAIESHIKNIIGRYTTTEKLLSGVVEDDQPEVQRRGPQPKPEVVRGEAEWQRLTGSDMRYPVKELTVELATMMSPGREVTLAKMAELVNSRLSDIERHLGGQFKETKSGTVLQALEGKSGAGGLVGDGVVERLKEVKPVTFRRL